MRIVGLPGSVRADSHNTKLLRAAASLLPDGAELEIYDGLKAVPPYDEDDERAGVPAPVEELRAALRGADAVLIATPEYNHSIPGVLKNALDWASRPAGQSALKGIPVAVVGASTGMFGAVWAQAETRKVAGALGAKVLDRELPVFFAHERFDADGELADDEVRSQLSSHLEEFLKFAAETSEEDDRADERLAA